MGLNLQNYELEGSLLEIHEYPDPVLTEIAKEVKSFGPELVDLCKNMLYTMYQAPGIGLAAPQIGLSQRIFVLDVDYERNEVVEGSDEYILENFNPMMFINPVIKDKTGTIKYKEGCLSVPGVYEEVNRSKDITVEYQDTNGDQHSINADGLLSICIQHENDHLDGVVFLERLSTLKRNFFKKKFK